ncbi:MAG: hypothetical protein NOU37_08165 [Candidatus Brocadiales bacterium]|nr:hypothetical protein [Candidatus Bathyanammoxibius amoris]
MGSKKRKKKQSTEELIERLVGHILEFFVAVAKDPHLGLPGLAPFTATRLVNNYIDVPPSEMAQALDRHGGLNTTKGKPPSIKPHKTESLDRFLVSMLKAILSWEYARQSPALFEDYYLLVHTYQYNTKSPSSEQYRFLRSVYTNENVLRLWHLRTFGGAYIQTLSRLNKRHHHILEENERLFKDLGRRIDLAIHELEQGKLKGYKWDGTEELITDALKNTPESRDFMLKYGVYPTPPDFKMPLGSLFPVFQVENVNIEVMMRTLDVYVLWKKRGLFPEEIAQKIYPDIPQKNRLNRVREDLWRGIKEVERRDISKAELKDILEEPPCLPCDNCEEIGGCEIYAASPGCIGVGKPLRSTVRRTTCRIHEKRMEYYYPKNAWVKDKGWYRFGKKFCGVHHGLWKKLSVGKEGTDKAGERYLKWGRLSSSDRHRDPLSILYVGRYGFYDKEGLKGRDERLYQFFFGKPEFSSKKAALKFLKVDSIDPKIAEQKVYLWWRRIKGERKTPRNTGKRYCGICITREAREDELVCSRCSEYKCSGCGGKGAGRCGYNTIYTCDGLLSPVFPQQEKPERLLNHDIAWQTLRAYLILAEPEEKHTPPKRGLREVCEMCVSLVSETFVRLEPKTLFVCKLCVFGVFKTDDLFEEPRVAKASEGKFRKLPSRKDCVMCGKPVRGGYRPTCSATHWRKYKAWVWERENIRWFYTTVYDETNKGR